VPGICDACGGELVQRADDTPGAVAKRLDRYEAEIAGLEQRFADQGLLVRIDGDRPIDEVTESIMAAIQARAGHAATRR
jgi:adenylate kinase